MDKVQEKKIVTVSVIIVGHLICVISIIHFLTCTSDSKRKLLDRTEITIHYSVL